ncbi:hypothetical protein BN946_scf184912.g52 [Trametes cinnabarina]|uniref:Uncharacterized protein n=1 Tax=Pycnoporus cinnabarinus TaxID=5643 RepID=A0A060SYC0_PYCCI|nr:hypothetical protein BN946_scf184912.g52 [Trametes cinnabarina]
MCRFLLGLLIGLPLPNGMSPVRLLRAVRALLDFLYLAQYPAHTTQTLELLKEALRRFHANKAIFVDLGIRLNFKLPKLHSLEHYILSILLFGTTDNYDTQYTERLHIDFAKEAYRATNHKDELPQMTTWLKRREKILRHEIFINWRLRRLPGTSEARASSHSGGQASSGEHQAVSALGPTLQQDDRSHNSGLTRIRITRYPSVNSVTFAKAARAYGATLLPEALSRFVVQYRDPGLSLAEARREATSVYLRFESVPAFHRLKFILNDAQDLGIMDDSYDTAHARPARHDRRGRPVPGRFDTVLINEDGRGSTTGIHGYRVGRIRLIFKIPRRASERLFPGMIPPGQLAYVDWFSTFTAPNPVHGLYKVSRPRGRSGEKLPSVIPVNQIRRSCHLYPDFGPVAPRDWSSSTVLDQCEQFWVRLRHVVTAALLAPAVPAYVEGTAAQLTAHIEKNSEHLLGIPRKQRNDPADWAMVKSAIAIELASIRSTMKFKLDTSIKNKEDIYKLTAGIMMYGIRPKQEHWGRFAFLAKKKGDFWKYIDQSLRDVRESSHNEHPKNAVNRRMHETMFFARVLEVDISQFPIESGALTRSVFTNEGLTDLQIDTERVVSGFAVDDKVDDASNEACAGDNEADFPEDVPEEIAN